MNKYFLCLANSFKHGGRCIAGIELKPMNGHWRIVRKQDGTPVWIRPISKHTKTGEIPTDDADCIKVLSVISLTGVEPCPQGVHSENVFYDTMECTGSQQECTSKILDRLVCEYHNSLFGNRENYVRINDISSIAYSLVMIHLHDAEVYIKKKNNNTKPRIRFNLGNCSYDLPITDPNYWESMRQGYSKLGIRKNIYAVLSLGLPYDEKHFKLVATLFDLCEDDFSSEMARETEPELDEMRRQNILCEDTYRSLTKGNDIQWSENNHDGKSVRNFVYFLKRNANLIRLQINKIMGKDDN